MRQGTVRQGDCEVSRIPLGCEVHGAHSQGPSEVQDGHVDPSNGELVADPLLRLDLQHNTSGAEVMGSAEKCRLEPE